jgi:hypothetical protein
VPGGGSGSRIFIEKFVFVLNVGMPADGWTSLGGCAIIVKVVLVSFRKRKLIKII